MLISYINLLGSYVINLCTIVGRFTFFFIAAVQSALSTKLKISKSFAQMNRIGVESLNIIVLTGLFTGMVLALQTYIGFQRVGGEQLIGAIVALGIIRELGPVLTGLMVTGRAGSAITAEIGTMIITEQVDALRTLRLNIFQYLVVPRIVASTFILPFLTVFSMIFGIIGGYIVCVYV